MGDSHQSPSALHHIGLQDSLAHPDQLVHVVMLPYPLQGHINPMMQLAKLLLSQHPSIRVTFVNTKYNHDCIHSTQCCAVSTPSRTEIPRSDHPSPLNIMQATSTPPKQHQDSRLQFVWIDNSLPPDFDYTDLTPRIAEFHSATYNLKDPFKQLLQNLKQRDAAPISCVLFGSFCPWVHSVAAEFGIPSIIFWTQSAAVFSMYYHVPLLDANGFFPYNKKALSGCDEEGNKPYHTSARDQLVSYIPGVPPLHPKSFPTLLHIDSISNPSLATIKEQFAILQNCDGVIINSFEELERETYQELQEKLPCPLLLVGPLIPSAFLGRADMNDTSIGASLLQEKSECIQWLDSQEIESVLYIAFGSIFNLSTEDLEGIACAIKGHKQPFLWVIRPTSSLHNLDDIVPKGFIEETKEYGLIIPWAPQIQVISHPSVGAFLTHCGWNSTIEGISMGLPMMPFPFISDQPTNCTYVCDIWKIGITIKRPDDGKVKHEHIEGALRVLFQEEEGKEMKRRANNLRDAARRAVLAQGSSSIHIERLMKAMTNQSVRVSLT